MMVDRQMNEQKSKLMYRYMAVSNQDILMYTKFLIIFTLNSNVPIHKHLQ